MQTRMGDRRIYDNFGVGMAEHPSSPDMKYLVFTDNDNEETHMFPMTDKQLQGYAQMIQESLGKAGLIIAGAHEMPQEKLL